MPDSTLHRPSLQLRQLSARHRCWLLTAALVIAGLATAPVLVAGLRSPVASESAVAAPPPCPEPVESGAYCTLDPH